MQQLRKRLYDWLKIEQYTNSVDRYRAQAFYILSALILIGWTLYAVGTPEWNVDGYDEGFIMLEAALIDPISDAGVGFFSLYVITLISIILTRRGYLNMASWAPMATWFISGVALLTMNSSEPATPSGAIVMLLAVGALLNGTRGLLVALALGLTVLILRQVEGVYDGANITLDNIGSQMINAALLIYLFLRFGRYVGEESVSQAMEERESGATVVSQIAAKVSQRVDLDTLLDEIVVQVRDNFSKVYHAQIFLLDEAGNHAMLVASTGSVGQQLLAEAHAIAVGTQSVIGQVTATDQPVIAVAGARDTIHSYNPKLPDTAVEAAFPLHVGDRLIGVLDVQSTDKNAFNDPNEISGLQAMADSTALAIDNIRQYETQQVQLREREAIIEQNRETMREVERLNEHLTGRAWSEYLRSRASAIGKDVTLNGAVTSEDAAEWTETLRDAAQRGELVRHETDDTQVIAVPLRVRGQVVGAMEFELSPDQPLSDEDMALLDEIGERFGLAAENARLIDESQRVAQREAMVNQISGRFQSSNDIMRTLEEAAYGLQDALHAGSIAIRIGAPPEQDERR